MEFHGSTDVRRNDKSLDADTYPSTPPSENIFQYRLLEISLILFASLACAIADSVPEEKRNGAGADTRPDGGYDRQAEMKSFNDSKAGVKGLADARLTKIPRFLVHDHLDLELDRALESLGPSPSVLVVDLGGAGRGWSPDERKRTVGLVREACETWGFFQVVNHGVPAALMEEMVEIVKICLEFKPEANC